MGYFPMTTEPVVMAMRSRGSTSIMLDDPIRPRVASSEAQEIYERNRKGSGVASLFTEYDGVSYKPFGHREPKKKQTNFQTENKHQIQDLERSVLKLKLDQSKKDLPTPPQRKYIHIPSKVAQLIKTNAADHQQHANTGTVQMNGKVDGPIAAGPQPPPKPPPPPPPLHRSASSAQIKNKRSKSAESTTNFLKLNIDSATKAPSRAHSPSVIEDEIKKKERKFKRTHSYGQLPQYLLEKAKLKNNSQPVIASDCPPGHVLLSEQEKQKTLALLKQSHADFLRRLNSLPVRTDTTFLQRKKGELERRLQEVEEAIIIFSRTKVYIKQDSIPRQ